MGSTWLLSCWASHVAFDAAGRGCLYLGGFTALGGVTNGRITTGEMERLSEQPYRVTALFDALIPMVMPPTKNQHDST
jgi:hypothetical protein